MRITVMPILGTGVTDVALLHMQGLLSAGTEEMAGADPPHALPPQFPRDLAARDPAMPATAGRQATRHATGHDKSSGP